MLPESWQRVRRLLAVRLDNIGDLIMLGPALRSLQAALPQAQITLLASPAGSQVAPLLPWVQEVIPWRAVWQDVSGALPLDPARELELVAELHRGEFDAAFIFTSFSQSPFPPAYACYLAGVPVRVGHSKEFGGGLLTHFARPPADAGHQVDRNLALLELAGLPVSDRRLELSVPLEAQARAELLLQAAGLEPQAPFVLLLPGASAAARRYPPERYAAVARLLAAEGLPVVVAGSAREAAQIQPVLDIARAGQVISLVGETDLPALAGLVRRAALVIANNSAGLHLAEAFHRPMVILYSGTEHIVQWMPRFTPARILSRAVACSPCYAFQCPYGLECLDVAPQEVVRAALSLLPASSPAMATPLQPANALAA